MTDHGQIPELFMGRFILLSFAGQLQRTVPAIFKTGSQEKRNGHKEGDAKERDVLHGGQVGNSFMADRVVAFEE